MTANVAAACPPCCAHCAVQDSIGKCPWWFKPLVGNQPIDLCKLVLSVLGVACSCKLTWMSMPCSSAAERCISFHAPWTARAAGPQKLGGHRGRAERSGRAGVDGGSWVHLAVVSMAAGVSHSGVDGGWWISLWCLKGCVSLWYRWQLVSLAVNLMAAGGYLYGA
eukprot:1160679-Pelagomonas_calceolata.AAC.3